jgi:hypothetical protein
MTVISHGDGPYGPFGMEKPSMDTPHYRNDVERIFHQWHDLAASGDPASRTALYGEHAVLESPLVRLALEQDVGLLRGSAELHRFFSAGKLRRPDAQFRLHRTGDYLTNGHLLFWEYPRETPNGEQIDIAEVMEIRDGKIQAHRIYWGWYGVRHLFRAATTKG